ncbi:MAG: DUF979 domain-containing protein [Solobacterium sp.]|jgi:uncharacterized membrane protein|nr:DUF979 domain-containing protein [Solobacterium sp.]
MYFTNPDITFGAKMLELLYIVVGLICIYAGIKNLKDKENPNSFGTFVFWTALGLATALARYLPSIVEGIIVVICIIPALLKKVTPGRENAPTAEETKGNFDKIGMKLFIPALSMGIFALIFGLTKPLGMSALVGTGFGVLLSVILLMIWNKKNTPKVFLDDSERFLSIVGPLSLLPTLLSILGSIFTQAGVGTVIASIVSNIIPQGNVTVGIIVFAVGMALFTMIMGNAFAAITVMTVGIGAPFVLAYGANPTIVGMIALTCGYCGTLMTPMAANFNIVPVAILEMKDRWGVIKQQYVVAIIMLVVQICYMIALA